MERNVTLPNIESADAYDAMALFYERHWGTRFLGNAKQLFSELLLEHVELGAPVLDLCCGTGEFAKWLDEKGLIVTGIDNSDGMLSCARTKVPFAQFHKADMRVFQLPCQFDFVTCFYNSINQAMTLADLCGVLLSVRRHLRPGGWFLFDMIEEKGYVDSWEADEVVHLDEKRCEIQYRYDHTRRIALCSVAIRETVGGRQQEFVIRQRPLSLRSLKTELKHAGFTVESVKSVREAKPLNGRLAILARARDPNEITDLRSMEVLDVGHLAATTRAAQQDQSRWGSVNLVWSPLGACHPRVSRTAPGRQL
jgi:SAM-dependent methyltransferase